MNIAIITQPLRNNYGGVLQNYALQQVLLDLGHNPTTIDQDFPLHIPFIKLLIELPKRIYTKYFLHKRKDIFNERTYRKFKEKQLTTKFIRENINVQVVQSFSKSCIDKFDAVIVGSDQVWRPIYNQGQLENMFLRFISKDNPIKRIAYAASFGTAEWEFTPEQTEECSELLSRFNAVSTRETYGIYLCRKYLNRDDVVCALDPTLLLNKEDYLSLCKDIPESKEKILYAYILDLTDDIKLQLENIAESKGVNLKIVRADDNCSLTVEEWLAMFRDAECVITDSFHGTVFSIIFHKEFYSISNTERGSSRFTSLLSQLKLNNRLYNSVDEIKINPHTDWDIVYSKLNSIKNFSLDFLKNNLEN